MQSTPQIKICYKCKEKKDVTYFYKNKSNKDGLQNYCKQCGKELKENNKEYRKEYQKEYHKKYQEQHEAELKIYYKKYYKKNREENKEKMTIYSKQYEKTDIGKAKRANINHKRRTITKQGDVTTKQILQLQKSKTCYWCETSLKNKKVNIDHYIPISKGGLHTLSNLVASCSHCNKKKSSRNPLEFAKSIGRLF